MDLLQSLLNEAVVDGDSHCVDVRRRRVAREHPACIDAWPVNGIYCFGQCQRLKNSIEVPRLMCRLPVSLLPKS